MIVLDALVDDSGDAIDELLVSYARGRVTPAMHALISSQLIISPKHRSYVAAFEDCASAAIEECKDDFVINYSDEKLSAILEHIFDAVPERVSKTVHVSTENESLGMIPLPLRRFIGVELDDVPWKTVLPGVWQYKLDGYGKVDNHSDHSGDHDSCNSHDEATLYYIRAGKSIPSHTHEGSEVTLVLKGAFSDKNGRYARGDVCVAGSEIDHTPVADLGEDCICFAVVDGRLRLTGPFGRIIEKFRR